MSHRTLLLTFVSALSLTANPANAHEFWLSPSRYASAGGAPVVVRALAGTGFRGEEKPWDPGHTVRFTARTARSIDLTRAASPGDFTWASFAPSDAGGAMVAFESGFTPIELPAAQFETYLANEGLDGPLATRRRAHATAPGRERYRRCAKAWLTGVATDRATAVVGMPLEIVPFGVPGAAPVLRARVLSKGRPLASALVKAWRAKSGTDAAKRDSIAVAWSGRTDARGEVSLNVAAPGEWLLSSVQMVPCPDRAEADWESTWASLTFERAAVNP
jgi:uncharacterized GH25 family protein